MSEEIVDIEEEFGSRPLRADAQEEESYTEQERSHFRYILNVVDGACRHLDNMGVKEGCEQNPKDKAHLKELEDLELFPLNMKRRSKKRVLRELSLFLGALLTNSSITEYVGLTSTLQTLLRNVRPVA